MNLAYLEDYIEDYVRETIDVDYYSYFDGEESCGGTMDLELGENSELCVFIEYSGWEHAKGFDLEVSIESMTTESETLIERYIPVDNIDEQLKDIEL